MHSFVGSLHAWLCGSMYVHMWIFYYCTLFYICTYRICSNKSRAQREAGARIEAECQLSVSLIETRVQIEVGFKYTPGTPAI